MRCYGYQVERIAKVAYDVAMKRGKRLCSVDKANVLDVSQVRRVRIVFSLFAGAQFDMRSIDALSAPLTLLHFLAIVCLPAEKCLLCIFSRCGAWEAVSAEFLRWCTSYLKPYLTVARPILF